MVLKINLFRASTNIFLIALFSVQLNICKSIPTYEYGELIGEFPTKYNEIKGSVYAVDKQTIFIKSFSYKSNDIKSYFAVAKSPGKDIKRIYYPKTCDKCALETLTDQDIVLHLPIGYELKDISTIMVQGPTEILSSVNIDSSLKVPEKVTLPPFTHRAHGLQSGPIIILDERTFYIDTLFYDGKGPDAYFWVGNGSEVTGDGTKVPNEFGTLDVLKKYSGESITIKLPLDLTVYDIEWLALWCITYKHNFGEVFLPKTLSVPPDVGQNKIGFIPPKRSAAATPDTTSTTESSKASLVIYSVFTLFSVIFIGMFV